MRLAIITAFLALSVGLSGCTWLSQKLSFGKKPPPVSPSTQSAGKPQIATTGPAVQTRPGQQVTVNKPGDSSTKPAVQPDNPRLVAATQPVKPNRPTTQQLAAENNQYKLTTPNNTAGTGAAPKEINGPVSLTDLNSGQPAKTVETPNLTAVDIDEGVPNPATKPAIQIIAKGDPSAETQPAQNESATQQVAANNSSSSEINIDFNPLTSDTTPKTTPKPAKSDQQDQQSQENEDPNTEDAKIELKITPLPPPKDYTMGQTEKINGVVMVINKVYITVGDLLAEAHDDLSTIPLNAGEDAFRAKAIDILSDNLHKLTTRTMLLTEAKAKAEEDDTKEIDVEVEDAQRELIAKYGTRSKLEQALTSAGKTLDGVLQKHRESLIVERYLRRKLIPAIVINPRMLEDYYKKHQAEFVTPKKVQMQMVFVPFSKFIQATGGQPSAQEMQAARLKAKEEIDKAAAELMSGADFGDVAKRYRNTLVGGEDGTWPMMGKGNFSDHKVEEVAFVLPEGKVSPVFETDTGYYIVKAKKVQEGATISFVDAQPKIEDKLRLEQFRKLSAKYYERLGRASANSVVEDGFKVAVDCAVERYFKK